LRKSKAKDNSILLHIYRLFVDMVVPLISCENISWSVFCQFFSNSVILLTPIFAGLAHYFGASFELFGREFGHLETMFFINRSPRGLMVIILKYFC
jgi:hypothetical protein